MFGLNFLVPSFILLCGVINDIKSRKVKNWLVLACAGLALLFVSLHFGINELPTAFLSMGTALLLCLPFVLTGILGAGDMKLFAAFALSVSVSTTINCFIYSLFWGALLGVFRALLSGQIKSLIFNTFQIVKLNKADTSDLHQIPYTVALLFGWLSFVSLSQYSGLQLW